MKLISNWRYHLATIIFLTCFIFFFLTFKKLIFVDVYGEEYALRLDDANKIYGDGAMQVGNATCLFVKNTFWSTSTQKYIDKRGTPTAAGAIVGNIVLDPRSHGNNIAELNA